MVTGIDFDMTGVRIILTVLVVANTVRAEWSSWDKYGECSRPCGGGLSNKTRTCLGASQTCTGTNIRYKVCNTQGCGSNSASIRDIQCQSYNNVSIKDAYFHWVPYYSSAEPCVLYCLTVETGFILKMPARAWNGTTCGPDEGGVCIGGRCKKVGCDDIVGSKRRLDPCGECGGGGRSCNTSRDTPRYISRGNIDRHNKMADIRFQWDIRWSVCSITCGTGIQVPYGVCKDVHARVDVARSFCSNLTTPVLPPTKECVKQSSCPYRWHASKWGSCSRTCGEGFKYRRVMCLEQHHSDKKHVTTDQKCTDAKPNQKAPCNLVDCPQWLTGPWSHCSVTCGFGQQKRKVVCRTTPADLCLNQQKPVAQQKCFAGRTCNSRSFQQDDSSVIEHDFYDDARLQDMFLIPRFEMSVWGACSVTCGVGYSHREVTCKKGGQYIPLSQCEGIEPQGKRECHQGSCPLSTSGDGDFSWQHRTFTSCSQTCGRGMQSSVLECVDTASGRTVVDFLCDSFHKPERSTRHCNIVECSPSWRVSEYGTCSVPCGGGRQSRDVECIQTTSNGETTTVPTYRCPDPVPLSDRSCNLKFCQAEWNTGSWGECSVTCGMGFESRPVYCVKHVKTDVHVNVSDVECIGPRPPTNRHCHFGDCYKLQQLPGIKERKGTFIQIKRTKRVKLFVGERAVLLPNQAVKIKCPVKNFRKTLIFWTKDHRLIPLVGRVRVSSNGALRISRANPKIDTGIFTCSVGLLNANVDVAFHTKREARVEVNTILETIFHANFNESFINRPQSDGGLKMKNTKYFRINSIENSAYDYSSFTTSNWTHCSAKCGWGTQTRLVKCNQVTDKFIRLLPEEECIDKGLYKPTSTRKCILEQECPQWAVEDWNQCSDEYCRKVGYSVQKRTIRCQFKNGTLAKAHKCVIHERPSHKQHCKNPNCTAYWRTSKWSECTPRCGIKGRTLRTLTCLWVTTKLPAFDVCRRRPRPSVSKSCKPAPCRHRTCTDRSSYCDLVGHLKMCRYHKFRRRCCKTCTRANTS